MGIKTLLFILTYGGRIQERKGQTITKSKNDVFIKQKWNKDGK